MTWQEDTEVVQMSGSTFIDGIGPPLEQIQDDHTPSDTQEDKDILALISEIARLTAALEAAEEEAEKWHREAIDWQQAKSEADSDYEAAEQRIAKLEAYGNEWCAGFLAGQENAYEFIARAALSASESE